MCIRDRLYGSRGTGKSTMVKSLIHEFWDWGLRLVEVGRDQLVYLPQLVDTLSDYRLPVIIFIDDLSFEAYETGYKAVSYTHLDVYKRQVGSSVNQNMLRLMLQAAFHHCFQPFISCFVGFKR